MSTHDVQDGTAVEIPGVAHIAPTEDPALVADLLRQHFEAAARRVGGVDGSAAGQETR